MKVNKIFISRKLCQEKYDSDSVNANICFETTQKQPIKDRVLQSSFSEKKNREKIAEK